MDDDGHDSAWSRPLEGLGSALAGAPGLDPPFRDRPDLQRPRSTRSLLATLLVVVVGGSVLALVLHLSHG